VVVLLVVVVVILVGEFGLSFFFFFSGNILEHFLKSYVGSFFPLMCQGLL
jgi:hypothetical protein